MNPHSRRPSTVIALLSAAATHAAAQTCIWSQPGTTPPAEYGRIVYDSTLARVIRVAAQNSQLTVWGWDGAAWSLISTEPDPGNTGPSLAFDSLRNRAVLFGGTSSTTWEWDGASWTQIQIPGPPPSYYARMVYDEARARITLVRRGTSGATAETWTYDGTSWLSLTTPPLNIADHSIAYDKDRQRIILLVTQHATAAGLAREVWEWNGAVWTRSDDRPFDGGYAIAYDTSRQRLIVVARNSIVRETWELNPAAGLWAQITPNGPTALSPQMCFDSARTRAVLYDNRFDNSPPQTWEYDGTGSITPTVITQHPMDTDALPGSRATFTVAAESTGSLAYRWRKYSIPLSNGGNISGADTDTLVIDPVSLSDLGRYSVQVHNGCAPVISSEAQLFVIGSPCYPNCDNSTLAPVLNVNDFICFLNKYAAADPYANCDGTTIPPAINVNDFFCFLNRFASGCP